MTSTATAKPFMPTDADAALNDALGGIASKVTPTGDVLQVALDVGSVNRRQGIATVTDGMWQITHKAHAPNLVAEPVEGAEDFLRDNGCKIVEGLVYGEDVIKYARHLNPLAGVIKQTRAIRDGNFGGFDKLQRQGLAGIADQLNEMKKQDAHALDGISRIAIVSAIPGGMSVQYSDEVTRLGLAAGQEILAPVFGGIKPSYNTGAETNFIARGLNLKAPLVAVNFGGGTIEIAYFLGGSWKCGQVSKSDVCVDWGNAGQSIDAEVRTALETRFDAAGVPKASLYQPASFIAYKHAILAPAKGSFEEKSDLLLVTDGAGNKTFVNIRGLADLIMKPRIKDLARRFSDHTATLSLTAEERSDCLSHIVVYGGTTGAKDFTQKFENALKSAFKGRDAEELRVYCAPDPMFGVLAGAFVNGADIIANNKQVYAQIKTSGLGL